MVAGTKCECRDEEAGVEGDDRLGEPPTRAPRPRTLERKDDICNHERRTQVLTIGGGGRERVK